MRALVNLDKNKTAWFMLIVLFFFFLLRLPSLFEPYWYGDEGITQAVGLGLNNGRLLYRDIVDNKPPLLYWLYAVLNSDQFAIRLSSLIIGLLSVLVFFFLAKKLFAKPKIYSFATIIFAILLGIPLIEGNIANAENFMLLPILFAALLILNISHSYRKSDEQKNKLSIYKLFLSNFRFPILISGLLLGIAFLFKVVALFDFLAFLTFLFFVNLHQTLPLKNIKKPLSLIAQLLLGFSILILITSLFFFIKGAISDFFQATFAYNVGYVGYGNKLIIPQGLLLLKCTLLATFVLFIFRLRKTMSQTTLFILVWFAFSIFSAFFSERPYTHYLLLLLPSFSLMVGLIFWDKKYQKITTIFLLTTMILLINNFHFYGKSITYYQNFIMFLADKKSTTSYRAFFDKRTPIDYDIALFIKPKINKNDSILVWGNNAQVYKLTNSLPPGKYTVAYHTSYYKDGLSNTATAIQRVKPKFIIIMPDQQTIAFSLSGYLPRIKIDNVLIYERIL